MKITSEADNSNFLNFANIPCYNQNTIENYDIISMISQLETPTYTVNTNERFNYKNININNYNYRNSNLFNNININRIKNQNFSNNEIKNNHENQNENLHETEIIDYSKPIKNNAFDFNQMIDNQNLCYNLKTPKNNEKIKYSTIQQKKKIKHLNYLSGDEEFCDDYVKKINCYYFFIVHFKFMSLLILVDLR